MCGTSRKTLEILRDSGCDVWIHEYLKSPPSRDELAGLYQRAGIRPRDGLRAKEPLADELGLNRPDVTDDEVLDAMEVAFREFKIVVEPGGAVALAAALTGKLPVKGRTVAVVCSGGNVDHATFIRALSRRG